MLVDFLLDIIAYNIGYFFIKVVTGGKYPKEYIDEGGSILVEIIGIIVFLAIVLPIFYFIFK